MSQTLSYKYVFDNNWIKSDTCSGTIGTCTFTAVLRDTLIHIPYVIHIAVVFIDYFTKANIKLSTRIKRLLPGRGPNPQNGGDSV